MSETPTANTPEEVAAVNQTTTTPRPKPLPVEIFLHLHATDDPVERARKFATIAHADQKRKDAAGTPYIEHPAQVVAFVKYALSEHSILNAREIEMAAWLHDVVEDTSYTNEYIRTIFGDQVAAYVSEVTNDPSIPEVKYKRAQLEKVTQLSDGAMVIKLADKLANCMDTILQSPSSWSDEKLIGYIIWSQRMFTKALNECKHSDNRATILPLVETLHLLFSRDVCKETITRCGHSFEAYPNSWTPEQRDEHLEKYLQGHFNAKVYGGCYYGSRFYKGKDHTGSCIHTLD